MNEILLGEIYVICIAILIALGYKTMCLGYKRSSQMAFLWVVLLHIVYFQTDIMLRTNHTNSIIELIGFALYTLCTFSWFEYTQTYSAKKIGKVRFIPLILSLCIIFTNPFVHGLFKVEDGIVFDGNLYIVNLLLSWSYLFLSAGQCLYNSTCSSDHFQRKIYRILASYIIIAMASALLQEMFHEIPIICAGMTLSILVVFLNQLEQMISLDPLTQLNNRNRMEQYLYDCMKEKEENVYLLVLDIDYFKEFNDKLGHTKGDSVLKEVATVLKSKIEKNDFVARYGGDEFIIVHKGDGVEELCRNICEEVKKHSICVSIGYANWDSKYNSWNDWFVEADKELYKVKKQR